jgi:hypothetical protein
VARASEGAVGAAIPDRAPRGGGGSAGMGEAPRVLPARWATDPPLGAAAACSVPRLVPGLVLGTKACAGLGGAPGRRRPGQRAEGPPA